MTPEMKHLIETVRKEEREECAALARAATQGGATAYRTAFSDACEQIAVSIERRGLCSEG